MPTRFLLIAAALATALPLPAQKSLPASPQTVVWGNYNGAARPVLTVASGEEVTIQTISTCGTPASLEARGVPAAEIPQDTRDIYAHPPDASLSGPGGHILTGPVAIEGAEPGDVLEVQIEKIAIDVPWSCNGFGAGRGFLPNEFPYSRSKIVRLDRQTMLADFAPGVAIPLHPFFGSMGVAASPAGKTDSAPPWFNAGNMDNKELVAGSTVYIPVNSKGANFEVGDGHASQGNGEVDITALETQLTGTFRFVLHKSAATANPLDSPDRLLWPRAETPTAYVAMGFDPELMVAAEIAVKNMIAFLSSPSMSPLAQSRPPKPVLSRADAYALVSTACDVDITQLVDLPRVGVHVLCPKALFGASAGNGK